MFRFFQTLGTSPLPSTCEDHCVPLVNPWLGRSIMACGRSIMACGCWQGHCNPPHQNSLVGNFSCRGMGHGTPQNSSSYCYCPRTNRTVGRQHVSDQFGRYGSGFISKLSHLLDGRLLSSCKNISLSLFSLRDRDDIVQILPRKLSFKHKRNTAQCFYEWTGYWYSTPEQ